MDWLFYAFLVFIGFVTGACTIYKLEEDTRFAAMVHKQHADILNDENKNLKRDLDKAIRAFEDLSCFLENIPSDCKLGPWCQGCQYAKKYIRHLEEVDNIEAFYCGKNEACKNFVQIKGE